MTAPCPAHAAPAALVLTFAGLAACTGDGAPRRAATVDTVAGVETWRHPAPPDAPLGWGLDTVTVLGDAFAEDVYQFDQVSSGRLTADDAGNLYVLDRQGHRVLKYDPTGRHLATFGREGQGPGELSQPIAVAVGPGDTVWVSDFSNSRLTGYPQDGGDPRTIPFPEDAGIPGQGLTAMETGFITTFRPILGISRSGGGARAVRGDDSGEASGPSMIPVLHVSDSLAPLDTLWRTPEPPMDLVELEAGGNVMIMMMAQEYYPEFRWAPFSDGGIVLSDSAAYALHVVDREGRVVRAIARDPAPRPVTEADREAARQRLREESEGGIRIGGGGPDEETRERILQQRIEKMTYAELVPRVASLRVDPMDRIWVGVSEASPGEIDRIDIYRRDGTLVGELRDFPAPDVFLSSDRIGVLRRDDLDVQQVVVLDIQRPETEVAGG